MSATGDAIRARIVARRAHRLERLAPPEPVKETKRGKAKAQDAAEEVRVEKAPEVQESPLEETVMEIE